jgi:membrane glycosyltransferase
MRSVAGLGKQDHFDLFILSDTTNPDIWVHEEAAFQAVREREGQDSRIFYRRRSANTGKKAGNVADWCRRWGANYEYMLVLDADSLMTGESVVKLAQIIENNPDFGLVQTVPISIGRNTLFGLHFVKFTALCWEALFPPGQQQFLGITPSSDPLHWGAGLGPAWRAFGGQI